MIEHMDGIMDALAKANWTLGEFFHNLFRDDIEDLLGTRHGRRVKHLLTKGGNHPIGTIVEKIYNHSFSQPPPQHAERDKMFSSGLPMEDLSYGRAALSSWALQLVISEREGKRACSRTAGRRARSAAAPKKKKTKSSVETHAQSGGSSIE